MSKKCVKCGEANPDENKFCKECGNKFSAGIICPVCNKENSEDSKFCKECGKRFGEVSSDGSQNVNNSFWEKRLFQEQKTDIVPGQSEDKVCPTCNTVNSAENKHCKKCGENLQGFSNINWQKIEPVPEEKPSEISTPEPEEDNGDKLAGYIGICFLSLILLVSAIMVIVVKL